MIKSFVKIWLMLGMSMGLMFYGAQLALAQDPCTINPVVISNADNGAGSLRQAVIDACEDSKITFDMNSLTDTISLSGGQIIIDKNLTVEGPGANTLTVWNSQPEYYNNRVFNVISVTATISGLTISGGRIFGGDLGFGGGIGNSGILTVINSTIANNYASGFVSGNGGGISNVGTLTLINSTVTNNWAKYGGGIYNTGTLFVNNSTISGNKYGGGISNSGTLSITNSTIADNSVTSLYNAGIFSADSYDRTSSVILSNTIVANTYYGDQCNAPVGGITANADSLDTDGTCGDARTTTPELLKLGILDNNGGPTHTHALLPGSVAINAGNNALATGLTTDQRGAGFPRILGDIVDVGAFEAQSDTTPPTCIVTATPNTLSQPNHKLVNITTSVSVADAGGSGPNGFKLLSIISSEADSGLGTGDVAGDIVGWVLNTADTTGQLRTERFAKAGRTYTFTYQASDVAGNTGNCSATVTVPKGK